MSMLSSQIDELRELADDIESRYGYPTAVKALRDAADTIWELRDDLQRANAENSKLRELLRDLYDAIDSVYWDGEVSTRERFDPRMRELGVEVSE